MTVELREATPDDAQAAADLVFAFDVHFTGRPERMSADDVLEWWGSADENRVAADGAGTVGVGSLRIRGGRCYAEAFVDPASTGRGIGTRLVEWAEEAARALGASSLGLDAMANDERGACLLRSRGYERIRSFFRMEIDLDAEPPPAEWPAGFAVFALAPGEEPVLHEAIQDAFVDHWRFTPRTLDEWLKGRTIEHDTCFLVRREGEVAAAAECRSTFLGMGWIGTLGTKPSFRRRGLGEALLRHALRELYSQGARRVGLGVDAESPTGATRLYERAGMRVEWASDVYERTLDG